MKFKGNTDEVMQLETITAENADVVSEKLENGLSVLWNMQGKACIEIDGIKQQLHEHQLIFMTEFHNVSIIYLEEMRLIRFNKPFYCIVDHDSEVGCKGILFFGTDQTSGIPAINISESDREKFEILWTMFNIEMGSKDNLQMEMLQVLLKRLLILCTRCFKSQKSLEQVVHWRMDMIREFSFLVEKHFRKHHEVGFYADKLHKSPKTLSNIFANSQYPSPMKIIHERLLLEARRLLHFTNKPIKAIAYELGYDDAQTFGRFFKNKEGISPAQFRQKSTKREIREKMPIRRESVPTH